MKHRNVSLFVPHLGCPHTCVFCNQRSISGSCGNLTKDEIIDSLEIAVKGDYEVQGSEIAFFGGSFTAIDRDLMVSYLETVSHYLGKYFSGVRCSTRPDAIDDEVLAVLKHYGVTAIELGAQSMNDKVLELNERGHNSLQTYKACELIKKHGFSLGLQMMTGLYGSDAEADRETAAKFIDIRPDTVRIYPTVVLENTSLADYYRKGLYTPPSLEDSVDLCSELLYGFYTNNIKVIRLGLHSGGQVEDGFVAGVYHPAFGELCMSRIYFRKLSELLSDKPTGEYTIAVPKGELSKVCGQKKNNRNYFAGKGFRLTFIENDELSVYDLSLSK